MDIVGNPEKKTVELRMLNRDRDADLHRQAGLGEVPRPEQARAAIGPCGRRSPTRCGKRWKILGRRWNERDRASTSNRGCYPLMLPIPVRGNFAMRTLAWVTGLAVFLVATFRRVGRRTRASRTSIGSERGLDWLAAQQSRLGHWSGRKGRYPTSMTALAGIAFLCEGSTTTQGKYARTSASRPLPGQPQPPQRPDRRSARAWTTATPTATAFPCSFFPKFLGEEEDVERREQLVSVLTRAVIFTGDAQTPSRRLGLRQPKDSGGFDEGSTTITQVQGLRGCRNAGIPVPKEIIDRAVKYIHGCTGADGGVQYNQSSRRAAAHHGRGHRLPAASRHHRRPLQ